MTLTVQEVEQKITDLNDVLNRTVDRLLQQSPEARDISARIQTWTEVLKSFEKSDGQSS